MLVFFDASMARLVLLLCAITALALFASPPQKEKSDAGPPPIQGNPIALPDGLKVWNIQQGTGDKAISGMDLTVNYTGWLTSGKKFDSSFDEGAPFKFRLGQHHVIRGWDEGLYGMRVGGKRRLEIPPDLAYGHKRHGDIPANSTLIFDIELLKVE